MKGEAIKQVYSAYTREDQQVWQTLFERQIDNLSDKACMSYLDCLDQLQVVLHAQAIPRFEALNEVLSASHGWEIVVVPGLIPVGEFFAYLADRKFCASTWLRTPEQLDYLEEPDMFHDVFGHIPLFMDRAYADYVQQIGELGTRYQSDEHITKQLQRLYWFTIEFGLMHTPSQTHNIYGAGIISSYGETHHIYQDPITVYPFDVETIMQQDFVISDIQTHYYEILSFDQLYESIHDLAKVVGA